MNKESIISEIEILAANCERPRIERFRSKVEFERAVEKSMKETPKADKTPGKGIKEILKNLARILRSHKTSPEFELYVLNQARKVARSQRPVGGMDERRRTT